jgi:ubiquitin-protein ligase
MSQKKREGLVRIKKELQDMRNDKSYESIEILEEHSDFHSATFGFAGPIDSPYEGYWFRVFVEWPPEYPWRAPKFTLLDKIWNPYVDYDKGEICADILETEVSPALTTQKYILSIASLISETKVKGDHSGFLNPKAASQMMTNYYEFS